MKDVKIGSIEELIKTLNDLPNYYIYRGHSDEHWKLESTLERILEAKYESMADRFENYAIDNFEGKFHLYDKSNDLPTTKLEWLSIMQHYGVPTRMLDFTQSPYIALYFALENANKAEKGSFAIYALNFREIQKRSLDYLKKQDKEITITYDEMFQRRDELFDVIDHASHEILWIIEPSVANLRIDRQAGCFLIAGCIRKTIEQLLKSTIYDDIDNYRFLIPCRFWENIFTLLQRMNIDSRTVYGDLEGLSRSIKLFIKAYS